MVLLVFVVAEQIVCDLLSHSITSGTDDVRTQYSDICGAKRKKEKQSSPPVTPQNKQKKHAESALTRHGA